MSEDQCMLNCEQIACMAVNFYVKVFRCFCMPAIDWFSKADGTWQIPCLLPTIGCLFLCGAFQGERMVRSVSDVAFVSVSWHVFFLSFCAESKGNICLLLHNHILPFSFFLFKKNLSFLHLNLNHWFSDFFYDFFFL